MMGNAVFKPLHLGYSIPFSNNPCDGGSYMPSTKWKGELATHKHGGVTKNSPGSEGESPSVLPPAMQS